MMNVLSHDENVLSHGVSGAEVESHKNKQLHITLAYKFPSSQLAQLETLAKKLDLHKPSTWEIRLYSKNPKYTNCEVGFVFAVVDSCLTR